eukprot:1157318-Pelagomonas_calceolata.AAC.2
MQEEDDKPAFLNLRMPAPNPSYTRIQPRSDTNMNAPTLAHVHSPVSAHPCTPAGISHHQVLGESEGGTDHSLTGPQTPTKEVSDQISHPGLSSLCGSPSPPSPLTPSHGGCADPLAAAAASAAAVHGGGSGGAVGCPDGFGGGSGGGGCGGGGGGHGSATERASQVDPESVAHHLSHLPPPLAPPSPPPPSPPPPSPLSDHASTEKQQEEQQQQHCPTPLGPLSGRMRKESSTPLCSLALEQPPHAAPMSVYNLKPNIPQMQQQQQQHGHQQHQESHLHQEQLDYGGQVSPHGRGVQASTHLDAVSQESRSGAQHGQEMQAADSAANVCEGSGIEGGREMQASGNAAAVCEGSSGMEADGPEIQADGVQGELPAKGPQPLLSRPQQEWQQQQQQQLAQQAWQARQAWQLRSSSLGRRGIAAAGGPQGPVPAAPGKQWRADHGPEIQADEVYEVPSTGPRPLASRPQQEFQQQQEQQLAQQAWQARQAWQFRSSSLGKRAASSAGAQGPGPAVSLELWGGVGKRTGSGRREAGVLRAGGGCSGAVGSHPNGTQLACEEGESRGLGMSHPLPLQGAAVSPLQPVPPPPAAIPWWRQCSNRTHRSALSTTLTSEISCGDESRCVRPDVSNLWWGWNKVRAL